ncbi:MAG TPA: hypothetical protein VIY09_05900 [Rhizomicrobium sp.]
MTKSVLLAAAAVLALSGGAFAAPHASMTAGTNVKPPLPPIGHTPLKSLYSQNSSEGATAIDSQNFSSSFAQYDDQGADDFIVPKKKTWEIGEVDVTGEYYNGSGPATSENVFFYKDASGIPGKPVASFMDVVGTDNAGSFTIVLPKKAKLKSGHYWVSVQANLGGVGAGGEWGWFLTSVQHNDASEWQNQGGGFGVCPTWGTTQSCVGYGPDFMFDLKGKAKKG